MQTQGICDLLQGGLPAGTFQILGTQATQYKARDAVTAWISTSAGGGKTLRALHGSTIYTLSTVNTANLLAVGSGFVIFSESGKTYSWSSASATKTLLLEATPTQMFISNGAAVFSLNSSVYRVGLN